MLPESVSCGIYSTSFQNWKRFYVAWVFLGGKFLFVPRGLIPCLLSDAATSSRIMMQWKQTNNLDFDEEILRGDSWGNSFQLRRIMAARNAQECLHSDSEWNPYMFKMAAQLTDLLVSTAEVSNLFSILAVLGGLLVMMTFIIKMLYQVTPTCLSFLKLLCVQGSGWWGRSDQGDPSSPSDTNVQVLI